MNNRDGFSISILASGSTGNATYIESADKKLLIDCGLSGKKTEQLLQSINRDPKDLDAIFVTHEHHDHVHGVGVMARRYHLPIYANEKTWQAMAPSLGKIAPEQKFILANDTTMTFGDIDISSFGVSHDAVDPQFYSLQKDNKRFVILTDTGYVSDRMSGFLRDADVYLLESNHDVNMLRSGPYPWSLKQRILSEKGHLSNNESALAITDMLGRHTKRIYLGHLSQKNNMKEVARTTTEDILMKNDTGINHDFYLYDTDPNEATKLYHL